MRGSRDDRVLVEPTCRSTSTLYRFNRVGLVIGDHVDVLGRYRRASLIDEKVIDPGLLTSGADFGDDEFFGLLVRIGERIAEMVMTPHD